MTKQIIAQCACGAQVAHNVPDGASGTMYFLPPPRCSACREKDRAEREARERDAAHDFYVEHIWSKVPETYRTEIEQCEDVIVAAIRRAWEDAQ